MGRTTWVVEEGALTLRRVEAEGVEFRRKLAVAQTLQEDMGYREKDVEMVEGWNGWSRAKEEVSRDIDTRQEGMDCRGRGIDMGKS
jgi:hypothetical protein